MFIGGAQSPQHDLRQRLARRGDLSLVVREKFRKFGHEKSQILEFINLAGRRTQRPRFAGWVLLCFRDTRQKRVGGGGHFVFDFFQIVLTKFDRAPARAGFGVAGACKFLFADHTNIFSVLIAPAVEHVFTASTMGALRRTANLVSICCSERFLAHRADFYAHFVKIQIKSPGFRRGRHYGKNETKNKITSSFIFVKPDLLFFCFFIAGRG
ncbi:MAG: hypothetical protein PHI35_06320 [Victivallaceae bacterium]|nr:hypothetical protein [Victivallaceae bacterium]